MICDPLDRLIWRSYPASLEASLSKQTITTSCRTTNLLTRIMFKYAMMQTLARIYCVAWKIKKKVRNYGDMIFDQLDRLIWRSYLAFPEDLLKKTITTFCRTTNLPARIVFKYAMTKNLPLIYFITWKSRRK